MSPHAFRAPLLPPCFLALALVSLHPASARAGAATLPSGFVDDPMASGLSLPTGIAEVPDPASRPRRVLFVEQYTARVGVLANGVVSTVGTVPDVTTSDAERGLLGIAVDPAWPTRPYIYVHYTDGRNGTHVAVSRFTLTGDLADTGTGQLAFSSSTRYDLRADFPDNAGNHNGGSVLFGPDSLLYVSLGDDATYCPALDITAAVGKILRVDARRLPATGTGPAPYALLAPAGNPWASSVDSIAKLVWAVGLRNPFRVSVDRVSGSLQIGDVGQSTWEELDFAPAGGMDFGWPLYEGPSAYATCTLTPPPPLTFPIADYQHTGGSFAIVGGPRYRVPASGTSPFPADYDGNIFYLDYYAGFLRRIALVNGSWVPAQAPGQPDASDWATGMVNVSDLVEFSDGSLWYCRQFVPATSNGEIRRIRYGGTADVPPAAGRALALDAPSPNPARGIVTIAWSQAGPQRLSLAIYDAAGRRVRVLLAGDSAAGGRRVWNGCDDAGRPVMPGLYFVRLEGGRGPAQVARLALLR